MLLTLLTQCREHIGVEARVISTRVEGDASCLSAAFHYIRLQMNASQAAPPLMLA